MGVDLRLPNINATTTEGQISQMRSYIVQLAEQLNWAFNSISNGETMSSYRESQSAAAIVNQHAGSQGGTSQNSPDKTFSDIKSLIIKSADIVEAYYKEFGVLLETEGKYLAVSDFGEYREETKKTIEDNYNGLEQKYENLQSLVNGINQTVDKISTNAVIKEGLLNYVTIGEHEGVPIYGIQVHQTSLDENGEEIINMIAQLSAEGLEIYGDRDSDIPTAIFKNNTMYVSHAEVVNSIKIGGYRVKNNKGLSFKWEGR